MLPTSCSTYLLSYFIPHLKHSNYICWAMKTLIYLPRVPPLTLAFVLSFPSPRSLFPYNLALTISSTLFTFSLAVCVCWLVLALLAINNLFAEAYLFLTTWQLSLSHTCNVPVRPIPGFFLLDSPFITAVLLARLPEVISRNILHSTGRFHGWSSSTHSRSSLGVHAASHPLMVITFPPRGAYVTQVFPLACTPVLSTYPQLPTGGHCRRQGFRVHGRQCIRSLQS